ncbi:MAG: glycosyltransferase family 4 protein [Candidatus Omnitrophica bacterium]|nr:glycosyltransferase family 4 protein [Candidatus Omnitrophota bacterium]
MENKPHKIKVAQVITRMDWGGSPDIVRILCQQIDPDLFDNRLIMGNSTHLTMETKRFLHNLNTKVFSIYQLQRNINPFKDLIALIRLYRCFRREKFDIVHTHTAKAGALGRIAARLAGVPKVVHTSHGHNFYGYFGPIGSKIIIFVEKILTAMTDKITALTELERRDFITYKVSPQKKIMVFNSGVEFEKLRNIEIDPVNVRASLSVDEDEILISMIGRLEEVKGPEHLIEAAQIVLKKNAKVRFLFVGDGALRQSLETRCNQMGINDKVIFTGWRADVPQILSVIDILVLPSINEAVGRILLEAGALGIPVVATYVGGVPEIIKDHETGILVPPESPDEIADAVMTLINDPQQRKRMGETAKVWVDDKFSAGRMVSKITGLYNDLLKQ